MPKRIKINNEPISDDMEDIYFETKMFPELLRSIAEGTERATREGVERQKRIALKEERLKQLIEAKKKKTLPDTSKLDKEIEKFKMIDVDIKDANVAKIMKQMEALSDKLKTYVIPKKRGRPMGTTKVVEPKKRGRPMSTKKILEITEAKPKKISKAQQERDMIEHISKPETMWKQEFSKLTRSLSVYVGMMERCVDRVKHFTRDMLDGSSEIRAENKDAKEIYDKYKDEAGKTISSIKALVKEGLAKEYSTKKEIEDAMIKEDVPKFATKFQEYSKFKFKIARMKGGKISGGSLSSEDLNTLLKASYDIKTPLPQGFIYDKAISSKTSKVFYNPNTKQAVVAHMGTQGITDWGNNAIFALAGKTGYKMTARFKEAQDVQKKAEKKYGKENITTIGHSQGGLQAEILGTRGKETITVNKATRPLTVFEKTAKNQTDVRSSADLVSGFAPFQKKGKKGVTIKAETYNPLTEHATDILDRYDGKIGTDTYSAKKQKKTKFNPISGFL